MTFSPMAPLEPHAATRLRERFGVELTRDDLAAIARDLADPCARLDVTRYRFVRRLPTGPVWLVNLEPFTGQALWVPAAIHPVSGRVATFLPLAANLTVSQVDRLMRKYAQSRGRRPGRQVRERVWRSGQAG